MLNFLNIDNSSRAELEAHGNAMADMGACLVAVWLTKSGDYEIVSNLSEGMTCGLLAGAVMQMAQQEGTAH